MATRDWNWTISSFAFACLFLAFSPVMCLLGIGLIAVGLTNTQILLVPILTIPLGIGAFGIGLVCLYGLVKCTLDIVRGFPS